MVALKRAPAVATAYKVIAEMTKDNNTPKMVTVCAPRYEILAAGVAERI